MWGKSPELHWKRFVFPCNVTSINHSASAMQPSWIWKATNAVSLINLEKKFCLIIRIILYFLQQSFHRLWSNDQSAIHCISPHGAPMAELQLTRQPFCNSRPPDHLSTVRCLKTNSGSIIGRLHNMIELDYWQRKVHCEAKNGENISKRRLISPK